MIGKTTAKNIDDLAGTDPYTVPLITLWDFFGSQSFGMARFFQGLQGAGRTLAFEQRIYRAREGRRLPSYFKMLLALAFRLRNQKLIAELTGNQWILGGQQFLHLFDEASLKYGSVVVFDLLALDYPDNDVTSTSIDTARKLLCGMSQARQIITISHHTRQRIVAHFDIEPERIFVIPFGVDSQSFRPVSNEERNRIRQRLGLEQDAFVVLYVGSEQRRKNLSTLVAGLGKLAKTTTELVFVKIGQPQSLTGRAKFEASLQESGLLSRTRILGYVAEAELLDYYRSSDVFAFPSVSEGFGVPLLEAMSTGLPVVSTDCTSIPEVVGDTALLVTDPYSSTQWQEAIGELVRRSSLRSELGERGRSRALRFDWNSARRRFIDVLKGIDQNSC